MKKLLFVSLFFSSFSFAQNDVEEMRNEDQLLLSENGRNSFRLEIKQPFTLNKVYTCKKSDFNTQFVKAEFPGGEEVFVKQLKKYANAYLDRNSYSLNGTFYVSFDVDKDGKMRNIVVEPKVQNAEMFIVDLKFSLLRIKTPWKPATCAGTSVSSRVKLKLNFTTDFTDS